MKTKILLLSALVSILSTLSSATVEVISPAEVRIDGEHAGKLADVIHNHPQLTSEVQLAAEKYFAAVAAREAEAAGAAAAEVARAQAEKSSALDKAEADKKAVIDKAKADLSSEALAKEEAQAKLSALLSAVDVIDANAGALPKEVKAALKAARQTRADKQREEMLAQKAKLEQQLAELSAVKP